MNFGSGPMFGDLVDELHSGFGSKTSDRDFFYLLLQRLYILRVAMSEAIHADSTYDIDISVPIDIGESAPLPAFHHDSRHLSKSLQSWSNMLFFFSPKLT